MVISLRFLVVSLSLFS